MDIQELLKAGIHHSCYPNAAYNHNNELVTICASEAGARITIDFSTLTIGGELQLICSCGYVGCRKKIRGFNHLPVLIQEQYIKADMVPASTLKATGYDFNLSMRLN